MQASRKLNFNTFFVDMRVCRFFMGDYILVAVLNPDVCYMYSIIVLFKLNCSYDVSNENGIEIITEFRHGEQNEVQTLTHHDL